MVAQYSLIWWLDYTGFIKYYLFSEKAAGGKENWFTFIKGRIKGISLFLMYIPTCTWRVFYHDCCRSWMQLMIFFHFLLISIWLETVQLPVVHSSPQSKHKLSTFHSKKGKKRRAGSTTRRIWSSDCKIWMRSAGFADSRFWMSTARETCDVVYSLAEEQDFQQVSNIYFSLWSHYTENKCKVFCLKGSFHFITTYCHRLARLGCQSF